MVCRIPETTFRPCPRKLEAPGRARPESQCFNKPIVEKFFDLMDFCKQKRVPVDETSILTIILIHNCFMKYFSIRQKRTL